MLYRKTLFLAIVVACNAIVLLGCVTAPTLNAKTGAVPAAVDLSGYWLVREDRAAKRQSGVSPSIGIHIPGRRSRRAHRNPDGVSAQLFLEFGEALKITQTRYGLFISYDRSVVEEYTFGENRLVAIGPIEAQRVSGWEEGKFVVETLDDSGTTLSETWCLQQDNAVLVRNIRISKDERDSFVRRQVFDRQSSN